MYGIELATPFLVPTDGTWPDRLAVHTVYLGHVVGHDDDGQEVKLEYDWLGGPTEEECDRYERERGEAAARGEATNLCGREREALAHMREQHLLRQ